MKATVKLPRPVAERAKRAAKTTRPSLDDAGLGDWHNMQPDKYIARLRKNWK